MLNMLCHLFIVSIYPTCICLFSSSSFLLLLLFTIFFLIYLSIAFQPIGYWHIQCTHTHAHYYKTQQSPYIQYNSGCGQLVVSGCQFGLPSTSHTHTYIMTKTDRFIENVDNGTNSQLNLIYFSCLYLPVGFPSLSYKQIHSKLSTV